MPYHPLIGEEGGPQWIHYGYYTEPVGFYFSIRLFGKFNRVGWIAPFRFHASRG